MLRKCVAHVKEVLIHGENKVLLLEDDDFDMSVLHLKENNQ